MTSHVEMPHTTPLTVALLQTDIVLTSAEENIDRVTHIMNQRPEADLYVLPEMWGTGFNPHPDKHEHEKAARALAWMKEEAAGRHCAMAGSLPVFDETDESWRNRFYFVTPDDVFHYDKRHLFAPGGEAENYTAGTNRTVITWRGWRILLQVCYDLRFPVFSRNRNEYDLALYVANWPASRQEVWHVLLRARAIENQCYVIAVNRVGKDPTCEYCGGSAVIDPYGHTLAACKDECEEGTEAIVDMDSLKVFRKKFPVLDDADGFSLSFSTTDY